MKVLAKLLSATLVSAAATAALAAGSPGVEHNTQTFLDALAASGGKPLETLSPADARAVLVGAQQSANVKLPPADVSERTITAEGKSIRLTIVRPAGAKGTLPAFMFFHGGGWILGDFPTHERLVRDLVSESGAVAVFVNYTPSPEAQYPVAIEQAYAATQWVAQNGAQINVDGTRLAVAGNSVGGNATAEVVEARLDKDGRNADPRTYSLYLSTRGEAKAVALELAQEAKVPVPLAALVDQLMKGMTQDKMRALLG